MLDTVTGKITESGESAAQGMAAAQHTCRRPASGQLPDDCGQVAVPLVRLAHAQELLQEACMGLLLSSCALLCMGRAWSAVEYTPA